MRRISTWLLACLACASSASAQVVDPTELADGPDPDCVAEVHRSLAGEPMVASRTEQADPPDDDPAEDVPAGRAIAGLDGGACLALLRAHDVPFRALEPDEVQGVGIPIRLEGPIGGLEVASRGGSTLHEVLDCRLAVALLAWGPTLRAEGVRALRHYSIFRPGARVARSGRVSGHAKGLAIDLAVVELEDGEPIEVLEGWEARARGQDPCEGDFEESGRSAKLRRLVCAAAGRDLFQVVLTPHYDRAHGNHVHLEVVPGVDWSYVH
ncbi:MAG TPA: extensin family protein [Sandaracinaceae bacterium LLY-WYZ-13_1]|nr:extensin family protein [Sandaracinaceae bacterium LLY-WYZ-13_1]